MKLVTYLILFIATCHCAHILPVVDIDLDGPPEQRWIEALRVVLELHGYENSFGPAFAHHNISTFNHFSAEVFQICGKAIDEHFPKYAAELRGLTTAFNRDDVTYEYLAAWVYFHEFGHTDAVGLETAIKECTAVLV
jgi:N-acylethanolamine-hydrolysing acid amidase